MRNHLVSPKLLSILFLSISCVLPGAFAQTQVGACGARPYCVETNDFIATVTSFRTSLTTSNVKVIDTTIRFQNKTNQPLILTYAINSGMATDDRGNRLVVGGPNGYRGIGYVNGSNFEPKFLIRPGGFGDAQFELLAQGWPKLVGSTHALDLTVDQINSYEGNQHTVGGEFPLHFQGLTNGSAGSAPTLGALASMGTDPTAGGPCGLTGAQGGAGKASSAVSNAASTLSNLGSLFGKKKASQNAGQVASAAAGCDPRVNNVANTAGSVTGLAAAANAQQAIQSPSNLQQISADAPQATSGDLNATQAAAAATGTTGGTPANLASSAFTRAKQAQLRRQQQNPATPTSGKSVAGTTPQQIAGSAPPADVQAVQGGSSEPWTPPADAPGTPPNRAAPAHLDPSHMPDIIGVHLGMDPKDALAVVRAHYPKNLLTSYNNNLAVFPSPVFQGTIVNPAEIAQDDFNFQATLPPDKQMIWRVRRITKRMHINRETLIAALRQKYGKESVAFINISDIVAPNDTQIGTMVWLFDESGRHISVPYSSPGTLQQCTNNVPESPGSGFLLNEAHGDLTNLSGWCASSYIAVRAQFVSGEPIIETVAMDMIDIPLALRTAHSTAIWYRAASERARQADLEKSKQAKPVF